MAGRCLRESSPVRQERRDAGLAASWVVAVDEVAERIEREVLSERHPESEAAWLDRDAAANALED
jgi:hypothetical protein